jgi:CBS domain containing-hemolysin-like protein
MKTLAEKGNKRAKLALTLVEKYDRLLSTILIGNNIVNILLSSIATIFFIDLFKGDQETASTVSTIVITLIVLTFGEITPKTLAKDFPERFAMFSAPIIQFIIWVFMPVSFVFSGLKLLLGKIVKKDQEEKTSQEELLMFVEEVEQEGSIDNSEGDLLRNAIEFTEQKAEDILTHRVDLVGIPKDATKEEAAQVFSDSKFSRLLVYEESIDNIVGILHQKNFYTAEGISDRSIEELMTPPIFVHQTITINDLLKQLQSEKSHIAVILDEYGGTLGIVTMEDILEELVGDIWDEHDEVVETFKDVDESTCHIDCSVNLSDFFDRYDITEESEHSTLGGWVVEKLDKLPEVGDTFTYERLKVTVTEIDSHRVAFVDVVTLEPEEIEEESEKQSED